MVVGGNGGGGGGVGGRGEGGWGGGNTLSNCPRNKKLV